MKEAIKYLVFAKPQGNNFGNEICEKKGKFFQPICFYLLGDFSEKNRNRKF